MKKFIFCAAVFILLTGSVFAMENPSDLPALSSGAVGCPPDQIQISNLKGTPDVVTWTAQCNNKTYYCSAAQAGAADGADYGGFACKEAQL